MTRKVEFQVEAEEVGIETLWKAMSKDKIDFIFKLFPDLLADAQILEAGGADTVGLGTLLLFNFGPAASNIPPYKERIVEWDETKHVVSFQGEEGGYLKLGFTHYLVSFKLDEMGNGKTSITATVNYDFEKGFDGTGLLDEFSFRIRNYIDILVSYLKINK